jgi:hypothetical protein
VLVVKDVVNVMAAYQPVVQAYGTARLHNKAVIKPIWSYGSKSNIVIMQRSQSKILRAITNAPRYVTYHTLYTEFIVPYVNDVIHERINKHHNNL